MISIKTQAAKIVKIFTSRDELSLRNIRISKWAAILVFPLSFIICDMRCFDIETAVLGLKTSELINFTLGFGWLVLFFLPKRLIIPALRLSAIVCAVILPFQMILPDGPALLAALMIFQFFIGICIGASFSVFCFTLNNVERFLGVCIIASRFGIFYHVLFNFSAFAAFQRTWGIAAVMLVYLAAVFCCFQKKKGQLQNSSFVIAAAENDTAAFAESDHFDAAVFLVILLVIINQIMWIMMNDMTAEGEVNSFFYGFGTPAAVILIIAIHFFINRSALYSWVLSLVFSLLGVSLLLFDSSFTLYSGSFLWGLGDSAGMIITYFMCGGAIKLSKSFKMYRIFCFMFFIYYTIFSGIFFTLIHPLIGAQSHIISFGVVLVLCCVCFAMMPYLQRKIFDMPWSDGLKLADVTEYAPALAGTEQMDKTEHLGLSPREKEIFILLLGDSQRKHIAYILKIGSGTVNFHINNLYRKLGIQSRAELFAKYGNTVYGKKNE